MNEVQGIQAWFNKHSDDEGHKFERIVDPPSQRRDLCAFILLDHLLPGKAHKIIACAEHDQIWLDVDDEDMTVGLSEDDVIYLVRCGVFYDDDVNSLSMFA